MADGLDSRVAENTATIRALDDDIRELREQAKADHHRLRAAEAAVALLVDAQKEARRAEASQYRRLELRVQWLSVAIAFAAILVSVVLTVIHH